MAVAETAVNPERWVAEHGDVLFRYAVMRVRDAATAEDLVQETLLAALRGQERFAGQAAERSWLIGILKHKIVDQIRRSCQERPVESVEELPPVLAEQFTAEGFLDHSRPHGPYEWDTNDAAELCHRKEFWEALDRCVRKLPGRTGEAFMLRELDGWSGEEVCKVLGVSATNFWVMLHRARMQLRHCLEQNWFKPETK